MLATISCKRVSRMLKQGPLLGHQSSLVNATLKFALPMEWELGALFATKPQKLTNFRCMNSEQGIAIPCYLEKIPCSYCALMVR
jgi:hypothetical protein